MKKLITLTSSVIGLLLIQANPSDAIVTYVGQETDLEGWRTTNIGKQFDTNGNNVYGEAGYIFYGVDSPPNTNNSFFGSGNPLTLNPSPFKTISSIPSYLTLTTNGQDTIAAGFSYPTIDDPRQPSGVSVSNLELGLALNNNITQGTLAQVLDIGINANFPQNGLRIGVVALNSGSDQTKDIQLGTTSATISGSPAQHYIQFFDITNVAQGDVIPLSLRASLSARNPNVSYAGLVFDEIPTPVPFEFSPSLGLLLMGSTIGWHQLYKKLRKQPELNT
jgi:hypothetical protein